MARALLAAGAAIEALDQYEQVGREEGGGRGEHAWKYGMQARPARYRRCILAWHGTPAGLWTPAAQQRSCATTSACIQLEATQPEATYFQLNSLSDRPRAQTPLIVAAKYGNEDVVRLLVEAGAEINAAEDRGHSGWLLADGSSVWPC